MPSDEPERRHGFSDLVGVVSALQTTAATLTSEVERIREWKDEARERCAVHTKRLEALESLCEKNAQAIATHEAWRQTHDLERAEFSGAWKSVVALTAFLQGAFAVYIALKGVGVF
jgi:hypothetical protein